jgi:pimeloyl-ACP methyl ester carboxylesterase
VPTLAIIGADDPLKPGVDALDGKLANLETVVIKNTDHMSAFASPEFSKSLRAFLAKQSAATQEKTPTATK